MKSEILCESERRKCNEGYCNSGRQGPGWDYCNRYTYRAEYNVNVLDISQTVMQGYFTMMMATEVSMCKIPLADLVTKMEEIGKEMGLSIRVQREDIFEAMHRV